MGAGGRGEDGHGEAERTSRHELSVWIMRGAGLGTGLLIVAVIALVAQAALDVVVLVIVSLLLAAALDPLVTAIRTRTRLSRVQTVALVYVSLLVIATTLVILFVPLAVDEANAFAERLPGALEDARTWTAELEPAVIGTTLLGIVDTVASTFTQAGVTSPDAETIVEVGLTAADAVLAVTSVFTMVFFWLISRETLQRFALALMPLRERHDTRAAWNAAQDRVGYWLRGQLALMTIVGVASTIAYTVLGVPNALLLGLFAGIVEIIPMVGPAIGVIPAVIVAFVAGGPELALLVVGFWAIIQFVEGQILVPLVMKNAVGLPPFLVVLSLLIGGAVAGLVGALLAVPIAVTVIVVLENAQARRKAVPLDTPDFAEPDDEVEADKPSGEGEAASGERASASDDERPRRVTQG